MLKGHTIDNTFAVADFDRATTDGLPDCATAFGVFPRAPGTSKKVEKACKDLFNHYFPIEISTEISEQERSYYMKEWNKKVMELLGNCIDEKQMKRVLEFAVENIIIRGGVKEAFQEFGVQGIPLIIFSAGVSNVIEAVMQHHSIPYTGIHSNELDFIDTKLRLVNEGVYIGHKGWSSLPRKMKESVKDRTHKLVIGDSLDDLHMGDKNRVITSIGLLNQEQVKKGRREQYLKAFDHVAESDVHDDGILAKILQELKK